jgi:hypothetical protein
MQPAVWYRAMPGTTETVLSERADDAAADAAAPSPVEASFLTAPAAAAALGAPRVGGAGAGLVASGVREPATALAPTDGDRGGAAGAEAGPATVGGVPGSALELGDADLVEPAVERVK